MNGNGQRVFVSLSRDGSERCERISFWLKHRKWIIYCAGLSALLGARQLNTVPERFFAYGPFEVRKVDDLFGSTYHLYKTQRVSTGKFTLEISKDEKKMTRDVSETSRTGVQTEEWGPPHEVTIHTVIKPAEEIFEERTIDLGRSKVFNDLCTMTGNWHVR